MKLCVHESDRSLYTRQCRLGVVVYLGDVGKLDNDSGSLLRRRLTEHHALNPLRQSVEQRHRTFQLGVVLERCCRRVALEILELQRTSHCCHCCHCHVAIGMIGYQYTCGNTDQIWLRVHCLWPNSIQPSSVSPNPTQATEKWNIKVRITYPPSPYSELCWDTFPFPTYVVCVLCWGRLPYSGRFTVAIHTAILQELKQEAQLPQRQRAMRM